MNKYIFLYVGAWNPTEENKKAWGEWFAKYEDKIVDSGNPFGPGLEIDHDGVRELAVDDEAIVGYTILNTEGREEAEAIGKACPIMQAVRVYEAIEM